MSKKKKHSPDIEVKIEDLGQITAADKAEEVELCEIDISENNEEIGNSKKARDKDTSKTKNKSKNREKHVNKNESVHKGEYVSKDKSINEDKNVSNDKSANEDEHANNDKLMNEEEYAGDKLTNEDEHVSRDKSEENEESKNKDRSESEEKAEDSTREKTDHDYQIMYDKLLDYERTLHARNQRRIKIGIKCIYIIPIIFLFLLFVTGSSKIIFLILWIASLFGIAIYLILVEYIDYNLQEKMMEIQGKEDAQVESLIDIEEVEDRVNSVVKMSQARRGKDK